jgi:hypothetical protein
MIDRFRHASPKSREERATINPQAKPDFWWKQTSSTTDSALPDAAISAGSVEPWRGVDLQASFASYLGDTAPLQASSRYNVPAVAAPPTAAA